MTALRSPAMTAPIRRRLGWTVATTLGTLAVAATSASAAAPPVTLSHPYDVAVDNRPDAVVIADFDGDGNPDFAAANLNTGTVSVRLGDGAGGFAPKRNFPMYAEGLVAADFDRDGDVDIAGANPVSAVVSVLLGDGMGGFAGPEHHATDGDYPVHPQVADLDGDGNLDVVVPQFRSGSVGVLLGDGTGGFGPPRVLDLDVNPEQLALGDLDGDGHGDIAVAGRILFGDGTGDFPTRTTLADPTYSAVVADFDGDGRDDVAFGGSLFLAHDGGGFSAPVALPVDPFDAVAADLNGDGRPDLAATGFDDSITVLVNEGAGAFSTGPRFGTARTPIDAAAGDFDGDGRPDVAVATLNGCCVAILLNATGLPPRYRDVVLADQPRGYWRFGDASGSVARDEVGPGEAGGDPGGYVGGFALGQPGAVSGDPAVRFDGRTGSVVVPDSFGLNTGDRFSLEVWLKRSAPLTRRSQGLFLKGFQLLLDGRGHLVLRRPGKREIARSTVRILDTTAFHHVVATKDGKAVRLYVDGADVTGRVRNTTIVDRSHPLRIGTGAGGFSGVLDEAALYGSALDPEQVRAHFDAGQ